MGIKGNDRELLRQLSYAANNPINFTDPTGMYVEGLAHGAEFVGPASPFSSTQFETRNEYVKWYDQPIESSPVQLDDLAGAKALVTVGGAALVGAVGMVVVKEGAEKVAKEAAESLASRALPALSQTSRSAFLGSANREVARGGVTAVGRAIQKHAGRSATYFSAGRNAAENATRGRNFLNFLFGNAETRITPFAHRVHGPAVSVRLPNGAGAQFTQGGDFIGLLEAFTPR